ncbi:MAG: NTP transferase domain-containing protein [Dehalococcoidia bacterium]|nr:NTP transferase domain-containing protein [Dehalococcoidia bacterium]
MQGIITAAARSPRLLPLTKRTPVSLLEVGGKAILDHQLNALQEAAVSEVKVITGFCADQIEVLCRGRADCVYNPFYEVCNIAMNLWLLRHELYPAFVLVYDDVLFRSELVREVTGMEDGICLVVDKKGVDKEAEKVALQQGAVKAIGKNVAEPYGEFIGVAGFAGDAVSALVTALEQVARSDLGATFPQLIQRLILQGQDVKVLATDLPWYDIDFPIDLEEARRIWR